MNWPGRPLTGIRTIVELNASTTTQSGLTVQATYDPTWYETGIKITNGQMNQIPLHPPPAGTASGTTPSPPAERATYPAVRLLQHVCAWARRTKI